MFSLWAIPFLQQEPAILIGRARVGKKLGLKQDTGTLLLDRNASFAYHGILLNIVRKVP